MVKWGVLTRTPFIFINLYKEKKDEKYISDNSK